MADVSSLEMLSLVKEICRVDHYQDILKNKANLKWAAEIFSIGKKGANDFDLMVFMLRYIEKFEKTPPDIKAFRDFISTEPLSDGALIMVDEVEQVPEKQVSNDFDYLADAFIKHVHNVYHISNYQKAAAAIETKGAAFVKNWIHKRWALDLPDEGPHQAGLLEENTLSVFKYIEKGFKASAEDNILPTGFSCLDNNVVIGFGQMAYIGIAGQSGHGKSMLLNTLVYNWLREGKNILYNSLEHTPDNIWAKITFLHSSYYKDHFTLPPFKYWRMGKKSPIPITPTDWENFRTIRSDIEERGGLPGRLDVQSFRNFEEIVAHAKTNHATRKYHAIIIDYLEHLDMPGDARYAEQEYKKIIKDGATLTRTFDNKRGIILVTPLPINKSAADEAGEFESENPEQPFGLGGIRGLTQINYDMDLILGVHSDQALKLEGKLVLFGLKAREGDQPPLTVCNVDLHNYLIREKTAGTRVLQERVEIGTSNAEAVPKDIYSFADQI